MSNITRATSSGRLFSGRVTVRDLNLEWFEDTDLADDVAADCLKLFETTESDFNLVRNQRWYKRLWSTLTGGNTRKLAKGCASLAAAQQLLLEVLQTHAQTNARSNALMTVLARGLRHVEGQQNQVVLAIVHMADRVELLEEEIQLHRRQLESDPANEYTWNQENRLLLFKVMVLAAMADGVLQSEEKEILDRKLDDLELTGEYLREAQVFLGQPASIGDDLRRIDSYRICLTMFRHALGIAYADGKIHTKEGAHIEHLKKQMRIREEDAKEISGAFSLHRGNGTSALLEKMSGGKKRKICTPDASEYARIDSKRDNLQAQERAREEAIREIRTDLAEVGPAWCEFVSCYLASGLTAPIVDCFEAYGALNEPEIEDLVGALESRLLLGEINEFLPKVYQAGLAFLGDLEETMPLPATLRPRFDDVWERVVGDDSGWESALAELDAAGADFVDSMPSTAWEFVKGAAIGAGSVALLGPLGLLAAGGATALSSGKSNERVKRAASRWDSGVDRLAHATDQWSANAARHLHGFYTEVVEAVDESIAVSLDPNVAERPLIQMYTDLEVGSADNG